MKRLNVLYKIFLGDWDHRTKFFPFTKQRDIKNLKYSSYTLLSRTYLRLRKPAVIVIPVGFFLLENNTINKSY